MAEDGQAAYQMRSSSFIWGRAREILRALFSHRPQADTPAPSGEADRRRSWYWRTVRVTRPPYHLVRALLHRTFRLHRPSTLTLSQVADGQTWACVDLGAFPRRLPRLEGLEGVVIMEDRDPQFFLSFAGFEADRPTGLNRHGPLHAWTTQADVRDLVAQLHGQAIKVAIGFWNYGGRLLHRRPPWVRAHPELRHIALSSQLYPFVVLRPEGLTYAEYIGGQYERLCQAFRFDGLMLGDGFCGFSSIWDPDHYGDRADTIPEWTALHRTIARAVHRTGGLVLAYDQMGLSAAEARDHGVDYRALAVAGLDILVFQSYPQAWAGFWLESYRSRFDLAANARNIATIKAAVAGTGLRVLYTLELGDSVERWWADSQRTMEQMRALDPLAAGRFLVWANDLVSQSGGAAQTARRMRGGRSSMRRGSAPRVAAIER